MEALPFISALRIHPIKSLCPVAVDHLEISCGGNGILHDREWALFDSAGRYINGKRCMRIHHVRLVRFDPPSTVMLETTSEVDSAGVSPLSPVTFNLATETKAAAMWFSAALCIPGLVLRRADSGGFADDPRFDGPTVISESTLHTVRAWFVPALSFDDILARLRPNIVVSNVPAFWEDSLVDARDTHGVLLDVGSGGLCLVGVAPVHRCVIPTRLPSTVATTEECAGSVIPPGFMSTFTTERERTLAFPSSSGVKSRIHGDAYYIATSCSVAASGTVAVRDSVRVLPTTILLAPLMRSLRPSVSASDLITVVERGFAMGKVSPRTRSIVRALATLCPLPLAAKVVNASVPPYAVVYRPSGLELVVGIAQLMGVAAVAASVAYLAVRLCS
jgi:uncharacterized protein